MSLVSLEEDATKRLDELNHLLESKPEGQVPEGDYRVQATALQRAYRQFLQTVRLAVDPRANLADELIRLRADLALQRERSDQLNVVMDGLRTRLASMSSDDELRLLRAERDALLLEVKSLREAGQRFHALLEEERSRTNHKRMNRGVPKGRPRKR